MNGELVGRVAVYGVRMVREGAVGYGRRRQTIRTPADAASVLWEVAGERDREAFVVLWLTTKHTVAGAEVIAVGGVDSCHIAAREVFRGALLAGAAAVIVGHNHPSGEPEPSEDDRRITARLRDAGRLLGVEVLDHVIVGAGVGGRRFVSLRERGGWVA